MDFIIYIWLFIMGSVFGSFLGCMGYRIPNKIKTTYPSSFCASCKKSLKWYMNIPIFSYIFQKGKCAYCHKKIGPIYFICELLGAILFPLNFYLFDFTPYFFLATIMDCVLIVTIVSDFLYFYISDRVIIISFILIFITLYFDIGLTDSLYRVVSAIILFLVMIGIKILGNSMFGRESLGDGDIKLMAVIGLSLGIIDSFVTLFFASIIALIFSIITLSKHKDGVIPFGPFLIMGALIMIYFGSILDPIIDTLF